MLLRFKDIMLIILFLAASVIINNNVLAKTLPMESGVYGLSVSDCRQNMVEQDHIFELLAVWPDKKSYTTSEEFCRVSDIREIGDNKYTIESKCEGNDDVLNSYTFNISNVSWRGFYIDSENPAYYIKCSRINMNLAKKEIMKAVSNARNLEGECRGSSGDDPRIMRICQDRDDAFEFLIFNGWCYEKKGQSGAEYRWHPCTDESVR